MPSSYIHYNFAKNLLKSDNFYDEKLVLMGSQGPDPLFFYGRVFPWRNHKISKVGSRLHTKSVSKTICDMIEIASKETNQNKRRKVFSYLYGYFMHYILDRKIHPYVYYFSYPNNDKRLFYSDHILFETFLDMKWSMYNNEIIDFPKMLKIDKNSRKLVSEFYYKVAPNLKLNSFYKAYNEMCFIRKITNHNYLIKKIFNLIGLRNSSINHAIYPKKYEDKMDVLNLKKEEFANPETNEIFHKSFIELFNEAVLEGNYINKLLKAIYNEEDQLDNIKQFINNIDFNGINLAKSRYFKSKFLAIRK